MPSRSHGDDPFVGSIRLVLGIARRNRFRAALIGGFALPFFGVQRATGDVDFLVEAKGAESLHEGLVAAGLRCLHRSEDAANYGTGRSSLSPVEFLFARRDRARAMLDRTNTRLLRGARIRVPVVDVEGLIGLKLQALANDPRRRQDEADIAALFDTQAKNLDEQVLRDYYKLFAREGDLDRLIDATRRR
jgi:hypothetical protein